MSEAEELTLKNIVEKLHELKTIATAKKYYPRIIMIYNNVPGKTLRDKFMNDKKVIEWIKNNESLKTESSKRGYYSAYLFVLSEFGFPATKRKLVSNLIRDSSENNIVYQKQKLIDEQMPLSDAKETFERIEEMYKNFIDNMDPVKYDENRMYAAYLHLIIHYGVIRNSELVHVMVFDGDSHVPNFINRSKKVLTIRDHKIYKAQPIKELILDDKFMDIIKPAKGALFFQGSSKKTNVGGINLYSSTEGLTKRLKKAIGLDHYELRKMKTSIVLATNNMVQIRKLAYIQGHSIMTQYEHYNKYNKAEEED